MGDIFIFCYRLKMYQLVYIHGFASSLKFLRYSIMLIEKIIALYLRKIKKSGSLTGDGIIGENSLVTRYLNIQKTLKAV